MKIIDTVGIDMSKLTFDARIHKSQLYQQFDNSKSGFTKLVKWVTKNSETSLENIIFVFEHTGLYSHQISLFLAEKEISFAIVPGLEIKRSLGIARGKDDKVDATKIALYAYRLRDELKPTEIPSSEIQSISRLLSLRERLVKHSAGFKSSYKEQKRVLKRKENELLFKIQEDQIIYLAKQINKIETELNDIICSVPALKAQFDLIVSIKGVGSQTALFMIVCTSGFTKFDKWRKFASYSGIAPFPNSSGTSLNGRSKVSHLANKKMKSLLSLCAYTSLICNPEMKQYYERRVNSGKNTTSTINVIRNKILARIFAVIERKTPYVNTMKYAV